MAGGNDPDAGVALARAVGEKSIPSQGKLKLLSKRSPALIAIVGLHEEAAMPDELEIRRRPDGSIDTDHYRARAETGRCQSIALAFARFGLVWRSTAAQRRLVADRDGADA